MVDITVGRMEAEVNTSNTNEDSANPDDFLLPGCKSLEQFIQSGFTSLMNAIKTSNSLPSGSDWDYYSSFPEFQKAIDIKGKQVLKLISMVFQHQGIKGNILRRDLEEKFDLLLDANDMILERVNSTLDELSGIKRNPQPVLLEVASPSPKPVSGSWNKNSPISTAKHPLHATQAIRLLTAKNIQRPQIKFKDKIDNRGKPFEPKLKDKPNSLKPLAIYLEETADGEESFNHPYQYELELFNPKESQLKPAKPIQPLPVTETPLVFVEEPRQIDDMLKDLLSQTEIAVDLENHSYRSFQGFTCLMQISTREKDYIIDTLSLRHCLEVLNEVFTKSSIVKVFHGADHDVEWLQRDFGLYLVNMFDTHQAARLLHFSHLSLAFLLKHYCGVVVDKRFQLADWRIRPIPEEMMLYAREDTHYLLYVYDRIRSDLLAAANGQTNILRSVIQRSTEICMKKYEKPLYTEDMHLNLLQKTKKLFNNRQLYALKEITFWRNKVAREEDESIGYVLPNHMMLQISECLPREMQGILACCNPIPPLVRQNLAVLHQIILHAREQPIVKVVSQEEVDSARAAAATRSSGLDPLTSPLLCPHDLSQAHDFRDDLSTLLESTPTEKSNGSSQNDLAVKEPALILKRTADVTLFGHEAFDEAEDSKAAVIKKLKNLSFTSPYQRYKMVKPFMEYLESSEQPAADEKQEESSRELTDEERVNRIREYFLEMSKDVPKPEILPEQPVPVTPVPVTVVKKESEKTLRKQIQRKRRRNKNNNSGAEVIEIDGEEKSDSESPCKSIKLESIKEEKTEIASNRQNSYQSNVQTEAMTASVRYDYSNVDFSRFQGGSSKERGNSFKGRVKEKFQGKIKNKFKWKGKQNQSMTYKNRRQ